MSNKPGTELKRLLSWVAKPHPDCDCQTYADAMDVAGVRWCDNNVEMIINWVLAEAKRRNYPTGPITRFTAGRIIRRAIRNASKGNDERA